MDPEKLKEFKGQIEFADLIERCQTLKLITPDDRANYFETLNGKVHTEINKLLSQAE